MPKFRSLLAAVALALPIAGCQTEAALDVSPTDIPVENQVWASALGINISQMTKVQNGVYISDIRTGTGTISVQPQSIITVYYSVWLADGTLVDSNNNRDAYNTPLSALIPGWRAGVPGMKVGGKRRLVLHSSQAYGANGAPPAIPPYANLVFDVEIVAIPSP